MSSRAGGSARRAPAREGRARAARRGGARRDRDPRAAREAGVHDAERLPAGRLRADRGRATTRAPRGGRAAALLRLQAALPRVHHFYDQLCPPCGDFNFAKRTETADLSGRVALLTGGRVKIGYQAGIKLLRAGAHADRHHPLPARRGRALRARGRLRGLGATGSRSSGSTCATRRASRRSATHLLDDARPARLHRQQRLPDRAPPAGLLPAHDRRARPPPAQSLPGRAPRGCSATYEGLRRYELLDGPRARRDRARRR